jgi:hypothetical protein
MSDVPNSAERKSRWKTQHYAKLWLTTTSAPIARTRPPSQLKQKYGDLICEAAAGCISKSEAAKLLRMRKEDALPLIDRANEELFGCCSTTTPTSQRISKRSTESGTKSGSRLGSNPSSPCSNSITRSGVLGTENRVSHVTYGRGNRAPVTRFPLRR